MNNLEIKKRRKELGFTQQELADLIGVSKNTIVNYEKGLKIPDSKIPLLNKTLFENYNIEHDLNANIVKEGQSKYFTISGYDKKINQLKELIKERRENLNFLPENHEDRKQILEIIKIYEERIRFIEIGKKDSQENK